jgi:hypothetical protein
MANEATRQQRTQPSEASTQTIAEDQWIPFLAEFTSENSGTHARLEVLGTESEHYVVEDRPFATAILARFPAPPLGPALEIISKDKTRTLLQLSLAEEHALPAVDR